jgi:ubiquitin C-terminal hydrolase
METSSSFQYLYKNIVFITLLLLIGGCRDCNNKVLKNPTTKQTLQVSERIPCVRQTSEIGKPVKNQGIPNIGNSCYMNSVIQILASFYREMISSTQDFELAKAANDIINAITSPETVNSKEIKAKARLFFAALEKAPAQGGIGWVGKRSKQEDAEELLRQILSKFTLPQAQTIYKEIHHTTREERLGTRQVLWDKLDIPMPQDKPQLQTMQDLFDNSLLPETVKKRWSGNVQANGEPNVKVESIPLLKDLDRLYGKMLPINLLRFHYDINTDSTSKITQQVYAPFKLIVKKEHILGSNIDLYYELVGFIRHIGTTKDSGHYVAYIKVDGQWILYNDNNASEVSDSDAEAAATEAYMYFYKQTKPRREE